MYRLFPLPVFFVKWPSIAASDKTNWHRKKLSWKLSSEPLVFFSSLSASLEQDRTSKFSKCFFFSLSSVKFKEHRKQNQNKNQPKNQKPALPPPKKKTPNNKHTKPKQKQMHNTTNKINQRCSRSRQLQNESHFRKKTRVVELLTCALFL